MVGVNLKREIMRRVSTGTTSGKTGITSSGRSGWAASTVKEDFTVFSRI